MYSVGELSNLTGLTARAIRIYQEKGLIKSFYFGKNGYRNFRAEALDETKKVQQLKELGFSLKEIQEILLLDEYNFKSKLKMKLKNLDHDLFNLKKRRSEVIQLLCVNEKINKGTELSSTERRMYMNAIKEDVINGLKLKGEKITQQHLDYLERDKAVYDSREKREFIEAVKDCVDFAKENGLTLGPGRGSMPASVVMYGLGLSKIDPTVYNLVPERLRRDKPDLHIDVEFERGQVFVDFCRNRTKNLTYGKINAFKMPLLSIIKNVHARINETPNYDEINEEQLLKNIRKGEIEKIFCIDFSEDALVMKYENHFPEYKTPQKLREFLKSQTIYDFNDLLNILAVWRPNSQDKIDRISLYREAKENGFEYKFLSPSMKEHLKPNFGRFIYHEDIIRLLSEYTDWDLERCGEFRRKYFTNEMCEQDLLEFRMQAPKEVVELFLKEGKMTFCRAHIIAFSKLIKITAFLQSQYRDIYFEEIHKWEAKFGFRWDDIGIKIKGVSLLQD